MVLDLAEAEVGAKYDEDKAHMAAWLVHVKSQVHKLMAAKRECARLQRAAEAAAQQLSKEVQAKAREVKLEQQENARLRWSLSAHTIDDLRETVVSAFRSTSNDREFKDCMANLVKAREQTAFQKQLDDAEHLADDMSNKLKDTRSQLQASFEECSRSHRHCKELERELNEARKLLREQKQHQQEQVERKSKQPSKKDPPGVQSSDSDTDSDDGKQKPQSSDSDTDTDSDNDAKPFVTDVTVNKPPLHKAHSHKGVHSPAAEAAAVRARIAELKRRQAAGELTAHEAAELQRLEGRLAALNDLLEGGLSTVAAEAEMREAMARVEELKRRQAAGELTAEEAAELQQLEGRLAVLSEVLASGLSTEAEIDEAAEIKARIAELKRRQAAGELTAEEAAELQRLESRLAVLNEVVATRLSQKDAAHEAAKVKERLGELKRRQAAGELTAEEVAELQRLESRLDILNEVLSKGLSPEAAAAEAANIKARIAELKRRQAAGELSAEEAAELQRLEGRLFVLDELLAGQLASDDDMQDDEEDLYAEILVADKHSRNGRRMKSSSALHGSARPKSVMNAEVVPSGRMITFTKLRAIDVPNVDRRGPRTNISDPYLIFELLDEQGETVDVTRTAHIDNCRNPKWKDTLRLFLVEDEPGASSHVNLRMILMDFNRKKADKVIGDLEFKLEAGAGKKKVEVPSHVQTTLRPYVSFRYEATPSMFYEKVAWDRVGASLGAGAGANGNYDGDNDDE